MHFLIEELKGLRPDDRHRMTRSPITNESYVFQFRRPSATQLKAALHQISSVCWITHHQGLLDQLGAVLTHILQDLIGGAVPGTAV